MALVLQRLSSSEGMALDQDRRRLLGSPRARVPVTPAPALVAPLAASRTPAAPSAHQVEQDDRSEVDYWVTEDTFGLELTGSNDSADSDCASWIDAVVAATSTKSGLSSRIMSWFVDDSKTPHLVQPASPLAGVPAVPAAAGPSSFFMRKEVVNSATLLYRAYEAEATELKPLPFSRALALLGESAGAEGVAFRAVLNSTLSASDFASFSFESPPVSSGALLNRQFEFVLVNAPISANNGPDFVEVVTTFFDLGWNEKDEVDLVAACPLDSNSNVFPVKHFAAFVRAAGDVQKELFWGAVGSKAQQRLKEKPHDKLYISTSGPAGAELSSYMRLESSPKHYRYSVWK